MTSVDPPVAVLVPTLNGAQFIAEQIEALTRQTADKPWHLVVVDGGSTDCTVELVRRLTIGRVPTTVIELSGAPGVNAGLNAGVRSTDSPYLAVAEHDDVVADGWLQRIVTALDTHWLVGSHMERFRLNDSVVASSRQRLPEDVQYGAPIVATTGMGFRRELWEALGGFDPTYSYGGNDIEFCLRAHAAGHPALIVDGATVHYRVRSGAQSAFRQGRSYGRTTVRLYDQFGGQLVPRRPPPTVARDWFRVAAWSGRGLVDRSYRLRAAFRGGLLLGYLDGSARERRLFL